MAITVLRKTSPRPVPGGQEGVYQQWFTCSWSTTDTTGTIPSGMRKVIGPCGAVVMDASAIANDLVSVANTLNADGSLVLGAGDTISLMRPAGTTSGCVFRIGFEGYP